MRIRQQQGTSLLVLMLTACVALGAAFDESTASNQQLQKKDQDRDNSVFSTYQIGSLRERSRRANSKGHPIKTVSLSLEDA